ncbi:MAG TPA: hypothetical protein VFG50_06930 [Rhodothermales bacterium]|nr:hypothetical protein [Rhodothermales bacterium]
MLAFSAVEPSWTTSSGSLSPRYKHSSVQFLRLRGWIGSGTPRSRAESDLPVLPEIMERLGV